MKTNASVTQILAYHDLNLGHKQHEVLRAIQHLEILGTPASCENIAKHLGYEKNRVTGRISELRAKGAIEYHGFTKSSFNKDVECYRLLVKGQPSLI